MAATDKPTSDRLQAYRGKRPQATTQQPFETGRGSGDRLFVVHEHFARHLHSCNGHDLTAVFPEIAHAVEMLPYEDSVLDGEVVVHDDTGRPSIQRLQKRGRLTQRYDIRRATDMSGCLPIGLDPLHSMTVRAHTEAAV